MDLSRFSVHKIRTELWTCHILSEQRCLRKACDWVEDLAFALPEEGEEKLLSKLEKDLNDTISNFNPQFEHAKTCFEMHEYDRAAYILRNQMDDDKSRFLHHFAKYKAAEKKRIDLTNEPSPNIPKKAMLKFNELRDTLERCMDRREPDGWLLYVYSLVLQKFNLKKIAIEVLERAINLTPNNWSAWYMLSILTDDKNVHSLNLPNHLFKVFFYYMNRQDLELPSTKPWVLVKYTETMNFLDKYFKNSLLLTTFKAKDYGFGGSGVPLYQAAAVPEAIRLFEFIRNADPYRVDAMEIYSNLLYVQKKREELSKLAYEIEKVDPFTSQANCCIANSFSAREQHTKAIVYFTRAIRINPDCSNSWTLIGHEYLELKEMEKVLKAYRFALTINKRDCRAWLGLGNTFETLMSLPSVTNPNYEPCLYYYSQVGKYRPKDQIMFTAMGSIFERMGDIKQAITCFKRGGIEGSSRLNKLYENNNMRKDLTRLSPIYIKY